jgi:3-deoxy-7-phosphoheptulonate synthase
MFEVVQRIISSDEAKERLPLFGKLLEIKELRDKEIRDIILGKSKKLLVIIGPCSADNADAVCDYVSRLSRVQEKVKEKLFIVPRIYTNKPRTKGGGYKGMYHQPDPDKVTDINSGIMQMREMYIKAISESGLTAANEMLYPANTPYTEDLISYTAIGARSSENQEHRLVASGMECPVGIKNGMNGNLDVLLGSINAAQIQNEFNYNGFQVKTSGNPLSHAVLRGSVDSFGTSHKNYGLDDIVNFSSKYASSGLKNPAIIIDTNHSNSGKDPFLQPQIVKEVLENMKKCKEFGRFVRGFLIESYIADGAQETGAGEYGKSITDACLGWEKTEKLLYDIAEWF